MSTFHQTTRPQREQRAVLLKVVYTLESNNQHTLVARLPHPVTITILPPPRVKGEARARREAQILQQSTNVPTNAPTHRFASASLKTCLSAICMASPDLFVDSTKDYILYAVDAVENYKAAVAANLKRAAAATSSTSSSGIPTSSISSSPVSSSKQGSSSNFSRSVLAGKGYLSRALEEPGQGHTTVNGRIVGGMSGFQAGSFAHLTGSDDEDEDEEEDEETLEVVLKLKEVERASRESHLSMLGNLQQPLPAVQTSSLPSASSLLPLPSTSHIAPGNISRAVSDPNLLSTSSNHDLYRAPSQSSSVNTMGPPALVNAAFSSNTIPPWPTSAASQAPAASVATASNALEAESTRASTPATNFDVPVSSNESNQQQPQQSQPQSSSAPSPNTQAQLLNLLMLLQQRQPNAAAAAAATIRTDSVAQPNSGTTNTSAIDSFSSLFGIGHNNSQPVSSGFGAAVALADSNGHASSSSASLFPPSSTTAPTPDGTNAGLLDLSSPHPLSAQPLPSQSGAVDTAMAHQQHPLPHPSSNMPNHGSAQNASLQQEHDPHQHQRSQQLSPLPPPFPLNDPVRPNQPLLPLSSSGGKSSPPNAGFQGDSNATAHFGSAPSSSAKRGSLDAIAEQKSRKLRRKVALSSVAAGTIPTSEIPAAFAMPTASSGFHGLGGLGASVSLGSSAWHSSGPLPRAATTQIASSRAGSVDGDGASVASGKSELKGVKYRRRVARESAAAAAAAAVAERDRAESLAGAVPTTVTTRKRSKLKDGSDFSCAPSEAGSVVSSSSKKAKNGNKATKKKKIAAQAAATSTQQVATIPYADPRPVIASAATAPAAPSSSPVSLKDQAPTAVDAGAATAHHDHSLRSGARSGALASVPHIAFPLSSPIRHSSSRHQPSSLHSDATTKVAGSSMSSLTTPLSSSAARFAFPKHLLQSSPGTAFDTLLSEGDLDFDGFGLPHNLFGSPGIIQHHGERLGGHGPLAGQQLRTRNESSGSGGLDSEGHQQKSRTPSTPRRRSPRKNPPGTHASMNPYASTSLEADLFGDEGESPLFGFVNMSPASEPPVGVTGRAGSSGSQRSLRRSRVLGDGATPGSTADRDDDGDGMGGDVFGSPSAHRAQRRQPRGSSHGSTMSSGNIGSGFGGDEQVLHAGFSVSTGSISKVLTATATTVVTEQAKAVPASPRPHTRSMSNQGNVLMSSSSLSALNLNELLQANLSPTGRGKSSTIENTPSISGSGGGRGGGGGGPRLSNELRDLLTGSPRGRVRVAEAS